MFALSCNKTDLDRRERAEIDLLMAPLTYFFDTKLLIMIKNFTRGLLLFFFLLGSYAAEASHIAASDISYRCLGGNQYEITLRLFRDCQGIGVPNTVAVALQSLGSCSANSQNIPLNRRSSQSLPLLCPSQAGLSSCNSSSGSLPGYEEIVYTGIADLSAYATAGCGWTLSYNSCCRNNAITNVLNASSTSLNVSVSHLPSTGTFCNSSPAVSSTPIFLVCDNSFQNIANIMSDPDGDSLSYALATPINNGGTPVNYTTGFSATQPLATDAAGYQFNPSTGQASFVPLGLQGTIVDVITSEYRNGVLISEARRSMQIIVINCANQNAITLDLVERFDNGSWTSQGTNTTFDACLGESIRLRATFSDLDPNDTISIAAAYSTLQSSYPGATLSPTYVANNQLIVEVNMNIGQFGGFSIGMMDNACPAPHISTFGFKIQPTAGCTRLVGTAFLDINNNCLQDTGEGIYNNYFLRLTKGNLTFTIPANAQGSYAMYLDTGTYQIDLFSPSPYHQLCPTSTSVTIAPNTGTVVFDLPIQITTYCPYLTVDIGAPTLVHCANNYYAVQYCNFGTVTTTNAQISVTLDPLFVIDSTTHPLDSQVNNTYHFTMPSLGLNQCGSFRIYGQLDPACNITLMGQTYCATAQIVPDTICGIWSGPNLEVEGGCTGDSVSFRIINNGDQAMSIPEPYRVIEDNIILHTGPVVSLNVGAVTPWFSFYANGSTYRTEIAQVAGNPWNIKASATVAGCISSSTGGLPITGMTNLFSLNDGLPSISIDCQPSVAAYDPNDKQGFPIGYGLDHYIERNTDLEYRIRFQNTGTFFATDVVIRDTLSPHLDAFSVQPQVSSHAYTWRLVKNNILEFTFDNIMLPDSGRDLAGSQGFIDFRIKQQPNLPLSTRIENTAGIYFDRNPPIYTNTTWHTIGENFIRITDLPAVAKGDKTVQITAFPNPFTQATTIRVEGDTNYRDLQLEVYNAMGQLVYQTNSPTGASAVRLERQDLKSGIYFYRLIADNQVLHSGKLIAQ